MGARPKPTQLKVVSGTDQPCRVRDDEPKPKSTGIKKPRGMRPSASRQFDILKQQLLDCKIVTDIDATALAMLANLIADMLDLQKKLDQYGIMVKGRNGYPVTSPYFRALNQTQEKVRKMLIEFGMTPSARTRVGTTGEKSKGEFDF